ncbi:unnamed protein product [Effrenium voratum]|nr:unnamed protein product [Effrenium voratum]
MDGEFGAVRSDNLGARYEKRSKDKSLSEKEREAAMYFTVAEKHMQEEKAEEALRHCEEALSRFRELGDVTGIVDTIRMKIHVYCFKDRRKEGNQIAKEELARIRGQKDRTGEAKMLLALAEVNTERRGYKNREEARIWANEALAMFRKDGDKKMQAYTMLCLLNINMKWRGDKKISCQEGLDCATAARGIFKAIGDRRGEGLALHGMAVAQVRAEIHEVVLKDTFGGWQDEKTLAMQSAEQAADIYKEIGEKGGETSMLQVVSQLHLELARPDKAFQVAQEIASMDISLHETAIAQETVYESFLQQGDLDEAIKVAQELVALCNDRNDQKREAIARLMVANVHYNQKDFMQAVLVAREAQALLHDAGAYVDEAAALRVVAEAYLANGELPQAIKAAERSVRLLKGKRKDSDEVQSLQVVASVKLQVLSQDKIRAQRGSPPFASALSDAMEAAEAAALFAREKRMKQPLGQALLVLGQVQLTGIQVDDALKTAGEAMEIFEELGSERDKANVMCLEADTHFTNGNSNKALVLVNKALAIFQEYRDSRGEWIAMNILEQITGPPDALPSQSDWTDEQWAQWNAWQQQQQQQQPSGQLPQAIQRQTQARGRHLHRHMLAEGFAEGGLVTSEQEQAVRRRTDPGQKLDIAQVSTDTVRKRVEEIVRFTADLDDSEAIELDQPLMQVGVTSRTAVGLRNMLSEELPGVDMPFTLIFDYPSVAAISDHIMDNIDAVG